MTEYILDKLLRISTLDTKFNVIRRDFALIQGWRNESFLTIFYLNLNLFWLLILKFDLGS